MRQISQTQCDNIAHFIIESMDAVCERLHDEQCRACQDLPPALAIEVVLTLQREINATMTRMSKQAQRISGN
jgi:hypothetical protein